MPPPLRSVHGTVPVPRVLSQFSRKVPHTDVVSFNGGLWCSEPQSNVLVPSSSTLADSAGLRLGLGVEEDVRLLLESALRLHGQFGGHDYGVVELSKSQVVEVVAF